MMDHKNVLRRLLHEKDGESEMNSTVYVALN